MMKTIVFAFGGVRIAVESELELKMSDIMLPFVCPIEEGEDFRVTVFEGKLIPAPDGSEVSAFLSAWRSSEGECTVAFRMENGERHPWCSVQWQTDRAVMTFEPNEKYGLTMQLVLQSLPLYRLLLRQGGLILHSSFVEWKGRAILFSAPSGIGKSTQASLWERFRSATVVNGDRALIRWNEEKRAFYAHGICYAGTSGICLDRTMPIAAIVLLGQAPANNVRCAGGVEAFRRLLVECAYEPSYPDDLSSVTRLLSELIGSVPVYRFDCLPDESAIVELEKYL